MNKKYVKSIHREQKSKPCDVPQKENELDTATCSFLLLLPNCK
jgi:hypothetical protein